MHRHVPRPRVEPAAPLLPSRSRTGRAPKLVGSRQEAVARRKRQTTPAATRALALEGDYPDNTRGPGLLASRSRPNQQPALEPEGLLSALPHAARPAGASAPPLVHAVP